jgi:mannan endo-1,4-beta-mannosidase
MSESLRAGRHRKGTTPHGTLVREQDPGRAAFRRRPGDRARRAIGLVIVAVTVLAAAVTTVAAIKMAAGPHGAATAGRSGGAAAAPNDAQPSPATYVGVFTPRSPKSYAGVSEFTARTGVRPALVAYYSGWREPFQAGFAASAARHNALPLVQMDPTNVSVAAIAAGKYDAYLRSYASAVKAFRGRVILSFGHEMNGRWYSWGYTNTSPAVFVAAWRHIVDVFRQQGARNVTWLWTVNIVDKDGRIPNPARWWPGRRYVTWVGIDGYYYEPSWTFASLFGPTIKDIRELTLDPILIAETGVAPEAGKPAKIANLFAGIRAYGLLGFVWFDASRQRDWRLSTPAAFAAFSRGAKASREPAL